MIQPDLLEWVPPAVLGPRDGETFDAKRDGARLNNQAADVYTLMKDGNWRSLRQISEATGHPEASISARLRDFRKIGYTVERRFLSKGLWQYSVTVK